MTIDRITTYLNDPTAFASDVPMRVAGQQRRFGEVWTSFQHGVLTAIAPALLAVAVGTKPPVGKFWIEGVKGSAKTSMIAMLILWLVSFSRRPLKIQIAASDQDQAAEVRSAAKDILSMWPLLSRRVKIDRWQITCRATSSVVEILAADTAGAAGGRPDVLVLEEAVCITKQEFAAHLLDNASKIPDGIVIVSTNAGFLGTWQWTLREFARTTPRWSFHQGTETPPHMDPAEVEEARVRNPRARFDRLFRCIWSAGSGDALDELDLLAAVDQKLEPMTTTQTGFAHALGLDLGVRHDHSAVTVIGVHGKSQRIRLAHCQSWAPGVTGRVDLPAVEATVIELAKRFNAPVYYDPYQCELLAQRARRQGVRMVEVPFSGGNLNRMASDLLDVFRSRRLDLYPDSGLLRDLRRLTIVEKSYGFRLESTRDADGHADKATSLALALLGVPEALTRTIGPWGGVINVERKGMYGETPRPGWFQNSFRGTW